MNYDRLTTIIGVVASFMLVLHNKGIIDKDIYDVVSSLLVLGFGYLTNKSNKRIKPPREARQNESGCTENNSGIEI